MHDLFGMYFTTKTCNNSVKSWGIMNYVYNTKLNMTIFHKAAATLNSNYSEIVIHI